MFPREQRFGVLDHASFPGDVHVEALNASVLALPADSFLLHLSPNHAGQATALILAARSRSALTSLVHSQQLDSCLFTSRLKESLVFSQ